MAIADAAGGVEGGPRLQKADNLAAALAGPVKIASSRACVVQPSLTKSGRGIPATVEIAHGMAPCHRRGRRERKR